MITRLIFSTGKLFIPLLLIFGLAILVGCGDSISCKNAKKKARNAWQDVSKVALKQHKLQKKEGKNNSSEWVMLEMLSKKADDISRQYLNQDTKLPVKEADETYNFYKHALSDGEVKDLIKHARRTSYNADATCHP